jgi:hypothetical protein
MHNLMHKNIFANFIGNWEINRTLSNNDQATGVANFSVYDEHLLHYEEELTVRLSAAGCVHEAYQEYYYFYDELEDLIVQKFSHGGVFITLKFISDATQKYVATAQHPCREDIYYATYIIENKDNFTTIYHVLGPSKDYKIITNYVKIY